MNAEAQKLPKGQNIDPNQVKLNYAGFMFTEWFVRLPKDVIADDLKEPGLWRLYQSGQNGIRKFDRLMIVAWDESWIAEAIAEHATREGVWLSVSRVKQLSDRAERLFGDGTYQVQWNGTGYHVTRLADGAKMTDTFHNAALAERALVGLYPRRA